MAAIDGVPIDEILTPPDEPVIVSYLLRLFQDIALTRGVIAGGMMVMPAALSHQEILAWQINTRRRLEPWEVQAIVRLDLAWRSANGKKLTTDSIVRELQDLGFLGKPRDPGA